MFLFVFTAVAGDIKQMTNNNNNINNGVTRNVHLLVWQSRHWKKASLSQDSVTTGDSWAIYSSCTILSSTQHTHKFTSTVLTLYISFYGIKTKALKPASSLQITDMKYQSARKAATSQSSSNSHAFPGISQGDINIY